MTGKFAYGFRASLAAMMLAGAAQAQTQAQTPAVEDDAPGDAQTIVVIGQREAERRAIETKRLSEAILDSVGSTDVGRLPDQNVAEAVRRLPGVSVAND